MASKDNNAPGPDCQSNLGLSHSFSMSSTGNNDMSSTASTISSLNKSTIQVREFKEPFSFSQSPNVIRKLIRLIIAFYTLIILTSAVLMTVNAVSERSFYKNMEANEFALTMQHNMANSRLSVTFLFVIGNADEDVVDNLHSDSIWIGTEGLQPMMALYNFLQEEVSTHLEWFHLNVIDLTVEMADKSAMLFDMFMGNNLDVEEVSSNC